MTLLIVLAATACYVVTTLYLARWLYGGWRAKSIDRKRLREWKAAKRAAR